MHIPLFPFKSAAESPLRGVYASSFVLISPLIIRQFLTKQDRVINNCTSLGRFKYVSATQDTRKQFSVLGSYQQADMR